jgi:murein DD-endopeptidase MepM/ murein hydrolase activator NlpD
LLGAELLIQPGTARPGDAVLIRVSGTVAAPAGTFGSTPLVFLPLGDDWAAIIGLSVDAKPGQWPIDVRTNTDAGPVEFEASVEVLQAQFRQRTLSVGRQFTNPSRKQKARAEADQRAFDDAFGRDFEAWTFDTDFRWPRMASVTAPFGDLRLLNGKKQSQHFGLDLDGRIGAPVWSTNDGVVVLVRDCFTTGKTVLIHHGGRLFSAYFHLSSALVKTGQHVARGHLLGKVGKSGRVTGPHLHFGVKLDGQWVNPESLFGLNMDVSGRAISPGVSPRKR